MEGQAPTEELTATPTGGPAQAPAQESEAMKGLNIMDSTIIPEDMRQNLVSIAAQMLQVQVITVL